MGFNRNLFWLSGFVIFLFSMIIVHYTTPPFPTANTAIISPEEYSFNFHQLGGIFRKIIKLSGAQDFVSLLTSIGRWKHHHRRRRHTHKCDNTKWANSTLIPDYNVTLVFTVDLYGCANFTSVQEAVDAVPESSNDTTLIIIDSGTFRSFLFLSFFS